MSHQVSCSIFLVIGVGIGLFVAGLGDRMVERARAEQAIRAQCESRGGQYLADKCVKELEK